MSNAVETSGDSRKLILDVMLSLKEGTIEVSRATTIIEGLEAINKSIQVEINAAKMSLLATAAGKDFGDVMRLGQRKIFGTDLIAKEDQE